MRTNGVKESSAESRIPLLFTTRTALLIGYGGMLLLLAFSGLDAIQVLSQMRTSNGSIRQEFLVRNKRLDEIRSAVYLSGTYVRDYLLEPDPEKADRHLKLLEDIRSQIESELAAYEPLVRPENRGPYQSLRSEMNSYWKSLAPAFRWDSAARRKQGYQFLRDEVFPRRTTMLSIADRIGGVNERELTAGDQRISDTFTAFRTRLVAVLAITLLLGIFLASGSMRHILYLERTAAQHLEDVSEARSELKDLSAKLLEAQENERRSISRELHDAVGQSLSAVLFEVRNLLAILPKEPASLRVHAATIRGLVENSIAMVRNMALLLRPSMLDDLGLVPALEWQARELSRRSGVIVDVTAENIPDDLPDELKTCIFRVVQEALHNVAKHAAARSVRIRVDSQEDSILLSVQDDGIGMEKDRHRGLGLVGIQERVENLKGSVMVSSEPGKGTVLSVVLPATAMARAEA